MTDLRHYDVIVSPVITEKSTIVSGTQPGRLQRGPARRREAGNQRCSRSACGAKVTAVNTAVRKGGSCWFRGLVGRQSDVKKAIVTLAEGQSIDVFDRSLRGHGVRDNGTQAF